MQSKKRSAVESTAQVIGGLVLSFLSYMVVIPYLFDIHLDMHNTLQLTTYFVLASWLKSYWIRRLFDA